MWQGKIIDVNFVKDTVTYQVEYSNSEESFKESYTTSSPDQTYIENIISATVKRLGALDDSKVTILATKNTTITEQDVADAEALDPVV